MKTIHHPLTWSQYRIMLDKAVMMHSMSNDPEWKHRWTMVQLRIMQAMTNPLIFWR